MAEKKFLKAYCEKSKQYYGIELEMRDGEWKAVNMVFLSNHESSLVSSNIRQDEFVTNTNLVSCRECGNRKIGGCSHPPKHVKCGKDLPYSFQCIYCDKLKLDYSAVSLGVGSQYKEGDVIRLSQGQEVKITLSDGTPLSKIFVGVGWDPTKIGANMDVDSSVVVAGQNGYELVYFGNKLHPSGCVEHHGDNLTGRDGDTSGQDDENITVDLTKVPLDRDRIIFVLNIYEAYLRFQRLGGVKNMYIRIYNPDSKQPLIEYTVKGKHIGSTGLVIGMAYRADGAWSFKAIGKGSQAGDVQKLAEECFRKEF